MNIKITPRKLNGCVEIPSSKSISHRMLIAAALSNGISILEGITISKDIRATIDGLTSIGAKFQIDDKIAVSPIEIVQKNAVINCGESGSTLRFLIPIAAAFGISATFVGEGKLPKRPITPFIRELSKKGINFKYNDSMPFEISGKLQSGDFTLEGDISSQFITGLLFSLPLCDGNSNIFLSSPLQSKPYVNMTIDCLKKFGVKIIETKDGYFIQGNQHYSPHSSHIEGDFSQAAFFFVANYLGSDTQISNLDLNSVQGDKKILEIIDEMSYNKNISGFRHFSTDIGDIPDLAPILAVLGSFGDSPSYLHNTSRLRIKESDRVNAIFTSLNNIGGNITVSGNTIIINPIKEFSGGISSCFNDHRIVMALAIASTRSINPIIIEDFEAVDKSFPNFFSIFNKLGGMSNVISLE